ncbi:MAG TPA: hypothetical protein VFI70_03535 [Nitrososphaeraceae archaeon]|nr:hypothetical protein [Nitrososphaeraceae archaeon]
MAAVCLASFAILADTVYSITTMQPENPFVISMSDLGPFLIMVLLDSHRKDYIILYRVVERIIENCDSELLGANKKSRFERYP